MVSQNYTNFKQALEYFVTHLEYIQNNNKNIPGYTKYLKPFIDSKKFKIQGYGYSEKRDYKIQNQLAPYSEYEYGRLFITIEPSKGYGGYTNKGCYLHWLTTAINATIESQFGISSYKAPKVRIFRSSSCEKVIEIKHTDIQEKIIKILKKQYGNDSVFQEVIIGNNRLDVLVMINENNKNVYDIYEVKPYGSFYACVREATGQLMEYKYKAKEKGIIIRKLTIVGPAKSDTKYLKYIQNEYSQSFDYMQIL